MFVYVSWTFLKTLVLVGCYIDTLREVGGRIVNLKKLRGGPTRPALQDNAMWHMESVPQWCRRDRDLRAFVGRLPH